MSHDHGRTCSCRKVHYPEPLELERHHVWPLGQGGPDTTTNTIWVCPTTHVNTHEILREFTRAGRALTYRELRAQYTKPVNEYAYGLARLGWYMVTTKIQVDMTPFQTGLLPDLPS